MKISFFMILMDPDKSGTIVSPKVCPAPILIEYPLGQIDHLQLLLQIHLGIDLR